MAFSSSNFVKSTSKTVGERLIDQAVSIATSGLPLNTISTASSTAQSLLASGSSFQTIAALTSRKTGASTGSGSSVFYSLAGSDPSRIAEKALTDARRSHTGSTPYYLNELNPSTKIKSKKASESLSIINAVV